LSNHNIHLRHDHLAQGRIASDLDFPLLQSGCMIPATAAEAGKRFNVQAQAHSEGYKDVVKAPGSTSLHTQRPGTARRSGHGHGYATYRMFCYRPFQISGAFDGTANVLLRYPGIEDTGMPQITHTPRTNWCLAV
jgi:hypothetical protein